MLKRTALKSTLLVIVCSASLSALAVAGERKQISVPEGDLIAALKILAQQSGADLVYRSEQLEGLQTHGAEGALSVEEAVTKILEGTNLTMRIDSSGAMLIALPQTGATSTPQAGEARADQGRLEEVIVTAQKREERLIDVPMSVAVVSQEGIDRKGIRNLLDLSRSVPGLVVTESGPGQNRIFMRGIANANNTTSLVGVYVDEMPVTSASVAQLDLQLVDLERVEVLKGPQGTLYGQGAAGGALRFITRDPQLSGFSGRSSVDVSSTEHGDPSVQLTGVIDVPVVEDRFGVRISGTYADLGGWIDQPLAGREDINDQNLRNVRIKALLKATDDLTVEGTAVVHRNHGDGITVGADKDYNVWFAGGDPLSKERFTDDYGLYNLSLTYDFGDVSLLSSTSYVQIDKQTDGFALTIPAASLSTFIRDGISIGTFSQELRLTSSHGDRFDWVMGAFFNSDRWDRDNNQDVYFLGTKLGTVDSVSVQRSQNWSVFGDASYALTDRLTVGAGLRMFRDERRALQSGLTMEKTFESVDPRVYLRWDVNDDAKLYINVAKGFRSGGIAVPPYGPESVWSYELGAKGASFNRRLHWEVAGFFSQYKDIQTYALTSGLVGVVTNAGDAEIKGLELSLAWEATDKLLFEFAGNVTDAEITDTVPNAISQIPGDALDFIPKYGVSLSVERRFDWGPSTPGFVRVDYSRVGVSSITDRTVGWIGYESDVINLVNARIGASFGRVQAEVYGANLFGENGASDPLSVASIGSRPKPRTLGVRVSTAF